MNRVEYFKNIRNKCQFTLKNDSALIPLEWIIKQLDYLIELEEGKGSADISNLENIKIGWIAVRELDGFKLDTLINELCIVSREVEVMKKERFFHEN